MFIFYEGTLLFKVLPFVLPHFHCAFICLVFLSLFYMLYFFSLLYSFKFNLIKVQFYYSHCGLSFLLWALRVQMHGCLRCQIRWSKEYAIEEKMVDIGFAFTWDFWNYVFIYLVWNQLSYVFNLNGISRRNE